MSEEEKKSILEQHYIAKHKNSIKITETQLEDIVKKVLNEQSIPGTSTPEKMGYLKDINPKKLKLGDKGDDVKVLQKKLMDLKLLKTKSMIPTGVFGQLTNSALLQYLSKPISKSYKLTPRIDQELDFIKQRGMDDKPFFIYDPKDNLIYLFNKNSKLVDYSSVVDGADAQKEKKDSKAYTMSDWCKTSGLEITPFKCTDPTTKTKKDPYYSVLANLKTRFLPKGIYSINVLYHHQGYEGSGANTFQLKDNEGNIISAAIHGIPSGFQDRLTASKNLENILKKDISSGKVPKEYLNSIKTIANANQSFGCIGVPVKFIDNPIVKEIAKGARVFVMGESGNSFLVNNSNEFFEKISKVFTIKRETN